jgi:hypothetical protein
LRNTRKMRCCCFRDPLASREIYSGCCKPTTLRSCPGVVRMRKGDRRDGGVVTAPTSRGA